MATTHCESWLPCSKPPDESKSMEIPAGQREGVRGWCLYSPICPFCPPPSALGCVAEIPYSPSSAPALLWFWLTLGLVTPFPSLRLRREEETFPLLLVSGCVTIPSASITGPHLCNRPFIKQTVKPLSIPSLFARTLSDSISDFHPMHTCWAPTTFREANPLLSVPALSEGSPFYPLAWGSSCSIGFPWTFGGSFPPDLCRAWVFSGWKWIRVVYTLLN